MFCNHVIFARVHSVQANSMGTFQAWLLPSAVLYLPLAPCRIAIHHEYVLSGCILIVNAYAVARISYRYFMFLLFFGLD